MLTFLELRELESSIQESEVTRYFYLEDGVMLQEKVLSENRVVVSAVSDDEYLEWILLENIDDEWSRVESYSKLATSSVITEQLVEFAMHLGYLKTNEMLRPESKSASDFDYKDMTFEFVDTATKPMHKSGMAFQTHKLYHIVRYEDSTLNSLKTDPAFVNDENCKMMIITAMITINNRYGLDTFDAAVYQEGASLLIENLANLCNKKYGIKIVLDNGLTNTYKSKSILYLAEPCADAQSAKIVVEKFAKRGTEELVIVDLLSI